MRRKREKRCRVLVEGGRSIPVLYRVGLKKIRDRRAESNLDPRSFALESTTSGSRVPTGVVALTLRSSVARLECTYAHVVYCVPVRAHHLAREEQKPGKPRKNFRRLKKKKRKKQTSPFAKSGEAFRKKIDIEWRRRQ